MKRLTPIFLLAGALALALGLPFLFAQPAPFNYPPSSGSGGTDYVTNSGGLATNLQVYSSGTTNRPLRVYGTNSSEFYINKDGWIIGGTGGPNGGSYYSQPINSAGLELLGDSFFWNDSLGAIPFSWNRGGGNKLTVAQAAGIEFGYGGDVCLFRDAAGVVSVTSGTAGTYRDLRLRTLQMYAQPSDPASSATLGMIYAKTNAGTTEVFVMDGAGNVTQISPHARAASPAPLELDTDAQPIVIHHANVFLGTEEFLHLSALAKEVEKISGKKFLFQRQLDPARKRDWATEETAIEQAHAAERAADLVRLSAWQSNTNQNKGPQPPVRPAYVKRPKPAWLNN